MKNGFERATSSDSLEEGTKILKAFRSEIYNKIKERPPKKNAFTINNSEKDDGRDGSRDHEMKNDDTHKR